MPVLPLSLCVTCAPVLFLTALCGQDKLQQQIQRALDAARPALLAHLRAASDPSTRPGELALLVLAAVHDGLTDGNATFGRAVKRLAKANPSETYDLALRLMVCEAMPSFPDRLEIAAADAKELLLHRHHSGTFGYGKGPGGWDLSNTQYGTLGLRSARALGVPIERLVWEKLADAITGQQDDAGGFNYGRKNSGFDSYPSMTAAGIAVLAICAQELETGGKAPLALENAIERGWQWFARHVAAIGSEKERWCHYFHYGLERAAILSDVTEIDGVDWYAVGASMLVDRQLDGGGWRSFTDGHPGGHLANGRGDAVPTSFAILFLRRKFQKVTGPITPHIVTLAAVGATSKQADVDACASELVRRGKPALPDVFAALRSDVEPRRRAAAAALHAITGDLFGYDAGSEVAVNLAAVHKAELWYLKNR